MTKNDKPSDALLLADFLPYRLSVLSNRISRSIADGYEGRFQLTLPEWRVMAVLGEEPDLSAGQWQTEPQWTKLLSRAQSTNCSKPAELNVILPMKTAPLSSGALRNWKRSLQ